MAVSIIAVFDATHENIAALPGGQAAGYTTGVGVVPWTAEDWAAHPGAVRICQDAGATDELADVLDVERSAATVADVVRWAKAALVNFKAGVRPGQRSPAIYVNGSNLTAVANALLAAQLTGIYLWVADWTNDEAAAANAVQNAGGPWPVIGIQYKNAGLYDVSVFSASWLNNVSKIPVTATPKPYPSPTGFTVKSKSVTFSWNPVVVNSRPVESYSLRVWGLNGQLYASQVVTGTSAVVNGLTPGATYKLQLWSNGGPVAPSGAVIKVTV